MKEKKYFKKNDKLSLYNTRLYSFGDMWDNYGEGYRQAIELIGEEVLENDRTNQDFLIYPYCFLMRHFIEIRLKEIIYEGNKKLYKDPEKLNTHHLTNLWENAQCVLKEFYGESYQKPPVIIPSFINEFNSIDEKSDGFRFPFDTEERKNLQKIAEKEINFKTLSENFEEVKIYLEGITVKLAAGK